MPWTAEQKRDHRHMLRMRAYYEQLSPLRRIYRVILDPDNPERDLYVGAEHIERMIKNNDITLHKDDPDQPVYRRARPWKRDCNLDVDIPTSP